jgi:tRNA nucleotidyltransferase (CCA-adding enzyme)
MGFHVAHTTNALMRSMVESGEIDHLVPERVWAELEKTLRTKTPEQFFKVLLGCNALARLFPEMEITNTGDDSAHGSNEIKLPVLQFAVSSTDKTVIRFAALICDIDNNNQAGLDANNFKGLCERHRIPAIAYQTPIANLQAWHYSIVHRRINWQDLLQKLCSTC